MVWRIIPEARLAWHCWGDDCVLYNDASGATHRLSPEIAALIRVLQKAPLSTQQLESKISPYFENIPSNQVSQWLGRVLLQLRDQGLVVQVS